MTTSTSSSTNSRKKVDAGATFIVPQVFYDTDIFLEWVGKVLAKAPGMSGISFLLLLPSSRHTLDKEVDFPQRRFPGKARKLTLNAPIKRMRSWTSPRSHWQRLGGKLHVPSDAELDGVQFWSIDCKSSSH
jgi:hypothetical protein